MQLIVEYGKESYYALEKDGDYFLIHEDEEKRSEEAMDLNTLLEKALVLLNDDPRVTRDDVYLAEKDLETYFSDIKPLEDTPGCYTGKRGTKKFVILQRHLVEDGPLDKNYYFPLLVAQLYPEKDAKDFLLLLKELSEQSLD